MRRKEKKRKEKRGKERADIFEGLLTARYREMLWGDGRRKRGRLSLKYWRSRRWAIGLVMAIGLAVVIGFDCGYWLVVAIGGHEMELCRSDHAERLYHEVSALCCHSNRQTSFPVFNVV